MSEPEWLLRSAVEAIHDAQLAEHGGAAGLRDPGLLESDLARAQNLFAYDSCDIFVLAAAYAGAITRGHPFVDGNKRTGFLVAYVFLARNGLELDVPEHEVVDVMIGLASGALSEDAFAGWLRKNCRPAASTAG